MKVSYCVIEHRAWHHAQQLDEQLYHQHDDQKGEHGRRENSKKKSRKREPFAVSRLLWRDGEKTEDERDEEGDVVDWKKN
jgi:Ni/Co efflux regulator RcnB